MSNPCEHIQPMILERATGALSPSVRDRVEEHLSICASCQAFAKDMSQIAQGVASLPRKQTSPGFDMRLAARLAEARRDEAALPAWRRALADILTPRQSGLRSSLALCGAAGALVFAVFAVPRPIKPAAPTHAAVDDGALVAQCIAQHGSDALAQPLDDWSAQNLSQHLDKAPEAAAPSAAGFAEESNF